MLLNRSVHGTPPLVSVIVPSFKGAQFLPGLLKTLRRQSIGSLEVIIISDVFTDDLIRSSSDFLADTQNRFELKYQSSAPAKARKAGLELACGDWITVIDAGDMIHHCRLERLISIAIANKVEVIADDMIIFGDSQSAPFLYLKGKRSKFPGLVSFEDYMSESAIFGSSRPLCNLRPVFRREIFKKLSAGFDESMPDWLQEHHLIAKALAKGSKYWIEPFPYYLRRENSEFFSYKLSAGEIASIKAADRALLQEQYAPSRRLLHAFAARSRSFQRLKQLNECMAKAEGKPFLSALGHLAQHPALLPFVARYLGVIRRSAANIKNRNSGTQSATAGKSVCLISRQRLAAATSGSSSYVLSLVQALRESGYFVHLIHPSPNVFGRVPVMFRRPEARIFDSTRARGAIVSGPLLIAVRPKILWGLLRGGWVRLVRKLGWNMQDRTAPYAISAPWQPADLLYIARNAPAVSDAVLFDYAYQTEAAPYILRPEAKSFAVMHDLVSSREQQFARLDSADSVPPISEKEELRLLSGADAVIAIQEEEARYIRERSPGLEVLCAPMAMRMSEVPHPGTDDSLLFVGTKTAPNVIGLDWFLTNVWPSVKAGAPKAHLRIAGSVSAKLGAPPKGVSLLGVVPDLKPLYEGAGIVISPLLAGSGLKIKLIEALSYGKAIVCTTPTIQGIGAIVNNAVTVADDAEHFTSAILNLLLNKGLRERQATLALEVARRHFSAEACYRHFLSAVGEARRSEPQRSSAFMA